MVVYVGTVIFRVFGSTKAEVTRGTRRVGERLALLPPYLQFGLSRLDWDFNLFPVRAAGLGPGRTPDYGVVETGPSK